MHWPSSPFYRELTQLLSREAAAKALDAEWAALAPETEFSELISFYHTLHQRGSLHLEQLLLQSFVFEEFELLGLAHYFPRLYRGIPRLHHRENPLHLRMRPEFTDLMQLKRLALDRALFHPYRKEEFVGRAHVMLVTWVMPDGLGDWTTAVEVARLLMEGGVRRVSLLILAETAPSLSSRLPACCDVEWVHTTPLGLLAASSLEELTARVRPDLLLQIPTYWPSSGSELHWSGAEHALPLREHVGEYGFVSSRYAHPRTGYRAMGLHMLEQGILTRTLEESALPTMRKTTPASFYLAYLATPQGGAAYLHALAALLQARSDPIHLCLPEIGWLLAYLREQERKKQPFLLRAYGIRSVEIVVKRGMHVIPLAQEGKVLHIRELDAPLTVADFHALLQLSEPWIGVRGNQSLSEVLSIQKPFFYDARPHNRHLFADLVALAEQRLQPFPETVRCLKLERQLFLEHEPAPKEEWIESSEWEREVAFSWLDTAERLGSLLHTSRLLQGFRQLSSIIFRERSCNDFLLSLAGRSVCHRTYPQISALERGQINAYLSGNQSFMDSYLQIEKELGKSYCNSPGKPLSSKTLLD